MNKIKRLVSVAAAMLAGVAFGVTDSVYEVDDGWGVKKINYNSKGNVERGEWTSQFNKTFELAKKEGIPLMVFWGNDGCGHCAALESEMSGSVFTSWQKEYGIYMTFNIGGYSGPAGNESDVWDAKSAAFDASGEFPYIGVWWTDSKGKFDQLGTFTGNGLSAEQVISKVKGMLKGYSPNQGGQFAVSYKDETDAHRYEAEIVAKDVSVGVKLVREASAKNSTGKDTVLVTDPSGKQIKKTTVSWEKGELEKTLAVKIPEGTFSKAGQKVTVTITKDDGKTAKYKTYIYAVAAENSPVNPDFKGCAKFGEWTMDIAAAKSYAAANDGLVLVCVQGSQWCPDCANVERNFLSLKADGKNRFQAWAKEKKLALVAIDVPNFESTTTVACSSPSLLKADPYDKALARAGEYPQSGASEDELEPTAHSGLGYLSRKGISEADAAAALERNRKLVQMNTDKVAADGVHGFHRPYSTKAELQEDGNPNRTGVPIFVLLRADGTVAARLTRMAAVSPMKADRANFDNYIKRFEEMLAIAADKSEIENNYPSAASIPVKVGESKKGEISNTDLQDSFLISGLPGNAEVAVKVSGASSAKVKVQFLQKDAKGAVSEVKAAETVAINAGKTFTVSFGSAGDCYALVKGADVASADFDVASPTANHFTAFDVSVSESPVLLPQEALTKATLGGTSAKVKVTEGKSYNLTGVKSVDTAYLKQTEGTVYKALKGGNAAITFAAGATVGYQVWNRGKITFKDNEPKSVKESVGSWKLQVQRTGGSSGEVRAKVKLSKKTDFYYDGETKLLPRFDVDGNRFFSETELVWKDGDKATKTLMVNIETVDELKKYYGDGKIVFGLRAVGDAELGAKTDYTLKVKEESKKVPSTVSLTASDPAWLFDRTVYARKSQKVKLTLVRSNEGDYSKGRVKVAKPSGSSIKFSGDDDFISGSQWWGARVSGPKTVTVSKLPSSGTTKVTLKAVKDSFTLDSKNNYVDIVSVADDAPAFVKSSVTYTVLRYTEISEWVKFDAAYLKGGTLSCEVVDGAIPSGVSLKVNQSKTKITLTGAASAKAGTYTAVVRAVEKRGDKTVKGLPIKIKIKVIDPANMSKSETETYGRFANKYLGKSTRTFEDLLVYATDKNDLMVFDEKAFRLAGKLTVTVPKTGKVSAQYTCRSSSEVVRFSAKRWEAKDVKAKTKLDSTYFATATSGKYKLTLAMKTSGKIEVILTDPEFGSQDLDAYAIDSTRWNTDGRDPAKDWRGLYTAALIPAETVCEFNGTRAGLPGSVDGPLNEEAHVPCGCGYLAFNMSSKTAYNAGKMKWAGKLPNGTKVSGSAVLSKCADGWLGRAGYAFLPIFLSNGTDYFSIVAEFRKGATKDGGRQAVIGSPNPVLGTVDMPLGEWEHFESKASAKADFRMDIHLFGSYYDPKKSLLRCCEESGDADGDLSFGVRDLSEKGVAEGIGYSDGERGKPLPFTPINMLVDDDDIGITSKSNPDKVTIDIDRETGVVSGTLKVPYKLNGKKTVSAKWAGVILTGWNRECDCDDQLGVYLPFICGGYWFTDAVPYPSGSKTFTEKAGYLVYGELDK